MPESVQSCFELSIHLSVFFSRELFLVAVHGWFACRQMYGKFKTRLDAFWHSAKSFQFMNFSEAMFY